MKEVHEEEIVFEDEVEWTASKHQSICVSRPSTTDSSDIVEKSNGVQERPSLRNYYKVAVLSVSILLIVLVALLTTRLVPSKGSTSKTSEAASVSTAADNEQSNDSQSDNSAPFSTPSVLSTTALPTIVKNISSSLSTTPSQIVVKLTQTPTSTPTTPLPTATPTNATRITNVLVIGDVPYNSNQERILERQMDAITDDVDVAFVVHVGDLRDNDGGDCTIEQFEHVAEILRRSAKPVFVLPGDNDWTDCRDINEGWDNFAQTFVEFETKYWPDHNFKIQRLKDRPETFAFTHQSALFIGLNLIGDQPTTADQREEWSTRLAAQLEWTIQLIQNYLTNILPDERNIGRVIIFGHADPNNNHDDFFLPLADFLSNEMDGTIPVLYVNGDAHEWSYDEEFYDVESFARITVPGLAKEAPTLIEVHANGQQGNVTEVFPYYRDFTQ